MYVWKINAFVNFNCWILISERMIWINYSPFALFCTLNFERVLFESLFHTALSLMALRFLLNAGWFTLLCNIKLSLKIALRGALALFVITMILLRLNLQRELFQSRGTDLKDISIRNNITKTNIPFGGRSCLECCFVT
jgi:hypothetical protein